MMTGDRGDRRFIEPEDHRRGYSVRPAYHPDPEPSAKTAVLAYAALVLVGVLGGLVVYFTH